MMPPGSRALAFASRWFDPHTVSTVFEPLIADWQREWHDATPSRRVLVWLAGARALVVSWAVASPRIVFSPWPAGRGLRTVRRVTVCTVALSTLLSGPFAYDLRQSVPADLWLRLLVLLLPSCLLFAFPFAVTTIVDSIRTSAAPTRDERAAALKSCVAACTVMLLVGGWVVPESNQQFRGIHARAMTANSHAPVRGLRELSIVELSRDDSLASETWMVGRSEAVVRELSSRLSLTFLPIVLMWVRWRALLLPRGRWYSPLPLVLSAPLLFGSFMVLRGGDRILADVLFAPRWAGPWLALMVLLAAAFIIEGLRWRAARSS